MYIYILYIYTTIYIIFETTYAHPESETALPDPEGTSCPFSTVPPERVKLLTCTNNDRERERKRDRIFANRLVVVGRDDATSSKQIYGDRLVKIQYILLV